MEFLIGMLIAGIVIGIPVGFFFGCRYERGNNDRALQDLNNNHISELKKMALQLELKNMGIKLDAEPNGL